MSRFGYEDMVQDALRSVVKNVLSDVAANGLVGDHHFYISFKTQFPGVVVPSYLVERHPDEMMIVLQYQYEALQVNDYSFSVSLSFNGQYERLTIPFNAMVAFVDPSVKFGLQFFVRQDGSELPRSTSAGEDCKIIDFNSFRKK